MSRPSTLARLSGRQQQIIEHVRRNGLSTNEVIQQQFFANRHASSVTRATSTLCRQGWLSSFPLVYPTKYLRLGKRAASAYGLTPHATYPLGPQALPVEFGLLRYVMSNAQFTSRWQTAELKNAYPWMTSDLLSAPHCWRRTGDHGVLELVRVDLGGSADYIARKCQHDVERRLEANEFRRLLDDRQFQLVIITGTTEKSARIEAALAPHTWPPGMQFRLAVFTDLLPLLPRSI